MINHSVISRTSAHRTVVTVTKPVSGLTSERLSSAAIAFPRLIAQWLEEPALRQQPGILKWDLVCR